VIPPVHITTAFDDEMPGPDYDRHLAVNRADPHDANVVISFNNRDGRRDAIGIPPASAIDFAIAILNAAKEVTR
jgi:hypothetical protein